MQNKPQRPSAEQIYSEELQRLREWDNHHRPPGWQLSPLAVEKFILGDSKLRIERKFVAPRDVVSRIVIGLATNRGAMLVGEPGTAKSWLSELLCAAISNQSTLTIQGGAIEQVNQLLYSWNSHLLKTQGPSRQALCPGPIYQGMQQGKLVRFEEIARCTPALQDAILSILSERMILIPELHGDDGIIYAREGFNIVATSNSLDEGVNVMSAALKRRLNFETIRPITKVEDEIGVIYREAHKLLQQSGVAVEPDIRIIEVLATIFHELRNGCSLSGRSTDRLASTVMSTAEAVAVAHAMGVHAYYYRDGEMRADDLVHFLIGAALKDNEVDRRRMKHYFETEVAAKPGPHWQAVYQGIKLL
ncbi:MAG: AAA family ATPase [Candidatus Pelagadaptatus aseana]